MKKTLTEKIPFELQRIYYLLVIFSYLYATNVMAVENTTMTFSTISGAEVQFVSARVIKEAYKRLNISVKIKDLPARRSLAMSNSGTVDGELSRVANLEKKYPSLIPVKVPVNFIEGMALSKDKPVNVDGWKSLLEYKLAIRRGVVFSEQGTKGMNVQVLNSWEATISALSTGRADVVIIPRTIANRIIKSYPNINIIINEPPIVSLPIFHYLHEKHRSMAPKIEKVIKKMATNGTIKTIIDKTRKELSLSGIKNISY